MKSVEPTKSVTRRTQSSSSDNRTLTVASILEIHSEVDEVVSERNHRVEDGDQSLVESKRRRDEVSSSFISSTPTVLPTTPAGPSPDSQLSTACSEHP